MCHTDAIFEHYQKTYELTYDLWKQRNNTFLFLIGVIGAATLLTYRSADTNSLLVDLIASALGISGNEARVSELRASFPFALLQSILLLVIFYLMVNLFHRALYVLRNYKYLGKIEREIREDILKLPEGSVIFTREDKFYWDNRPLLLAAVKWIYVVLLGIPLFLFLGGRLMQDYYASSQIVFLLDLVIATPTALFFLAFAYYSVKWDAAPNDPKKIAVTRTNG